MADIEKVIKETEDGIAFAESRGFGGLANTMRDALELLKEQEKPNGKCVNECECWNSAYERGKQDALKEQEAVEPYSHLTEDADLYFTCGKCGNVIWSESYKYCPTCGLKVAWDGEGR